MTTDYLCKPLTDLIGRTIESVSVNDTKTQLAFTLAPDSHAGKGNRLFVTAEGDCCSSSWFEHLAGLEALIGQKVLAVVTREMPADLLDGVDEKGERHECLSFYGWTLETPRGRCDIEMRNSSNGYYGGSLREESSIEGNHTTIQEDF